MNNNPFDYIKSISNGIDPIRGTENEALAEKGYAPFMINRGFSYFPDTIQLANLMNTSGHLDKLLQNDFYINTIRARKRFSKWHKPSESKKLQLIVAQIKEVKEHPNADRLYVLKSIQVASNASWWREFVIVIVSRN